MAITSTSTVLTATQQEFFRENGYLILESLLSADEVEELREASERLQGVR
jgi:ectoine hydroxylase-related dioxygenase (phytanoyl-CoA dioxygenase family)